VAGAINVIGSCLGYPSLAFRVGRGCPPYLLATTH
jgi:hypothetical protein